MSKFQQGIPGVKDNNNMIIVISAVVVITLMYFIYSRYISGNYWLSQFTISNPSTWFLFKEKVVVPKKYILGTQVINKNEFISGKKFFIKTYHGKFLTLGATPNQSENLSSEYVYGISLSNQGRYLITTFGLAKKMGVISSDHLSNGFAFKEFVLKESSVKELFIGIKEDGEMFHQTTNKENPGMFSTFQIWNATEVVVEDFKNTSHLSGYNLVK